MIAVLICREYKWTYEEYMNQPADFIKNIIEMLTAEAEDSKNRNKK